MKGSFFLMLFAVTAFLGCASPERRAAEQSGTDMNQYPDTSQSDTLNNPDGRSGDNGTGTDTTNTAEQKIIRGSGQ